MCVRKAGLCHCHSASARQITSASHHIQHCICRLAMHTRISPPGIEPARYVEGCQSMGLQGGGWCLLKAKRARTSLRPTTWNCLNCENIVSVRWVQRVDCSHAVYQQ